jgi:hypothetical protein
VAVIITHTGRTLVLSVGFVVVYWLPPDDGFTYKISPGLYGVGKNARGTVVVSKYCPNGRNENQSVVGTPIDVTTPTVC